jgi:cystathionine beta-lyase
MRCDFDQIVQLAHFTDSVKWCVYDEDVIPLWVADMDFPAPPAVVQALRERVDHGVFGYALPPEGLRQVIQERLAQLYDWQVEEKEILFVPGVVSGFNLVCKAVGEPGDEILVEPPVYPPMLEAPENTDRVCTEVSLFEGPERYEHNFDAFEAAITDRTSLFLLCSPHNPVGRAFERDELARLAEICLRHDIVICSDEIHCDILFEGRRHIPIATLAPELASQTVTLFAPSKTFNIPGLSCSIGVVQNPDLKEKMTQAGKGILPHVNVLGYTAAMAAYQDGQAWLDELLVYLEDNCAYMLAYLSEHMPEIRCNKPEATFLAWLDCRQAGISGNAQKFFLHEAGVALGDGRYFGKEGEGFVRLNFACSRETLVKALERMRAVWEKRGEFIEPQEKA